MAEISRAAYRRLLGPTTDDRIRLADTNLFVQVERDLCVADECDHSDSGHCGSIARHESGTGTACPS